MTGFNTEITRSFIGDNCWFHRNYAGDSVLDEDVGIGSGTVLANFRLDEREVASQVSGVKIKTGRFKLGAIIGEGVRLGVNASVMPGVKIGANSFIGAGVVLDRDLPAESFCVAKKAYSVSKNKYQATTCIRVKLKKKL